MNSELEDVSSNKSIKISQSFCSASKITSLCKMWLSSLILRDGDVKPNPGPVSTDSIDDSLHNMSINWSNLTELQNCFSVVHYNVQSIASKLDIIKAELCNFDVLTFTETWLDASLSNDDLKINGFDIFRRDRTSDRYGGILTYVRSNLISKRRTDLEITEIENLWIEIKVNTKHVLLGTFYRPPNSSSSVLEKIEQSIDLATDSRIPTLAIAGDFNLDFTTNVSSKFLNILNSYGLTQIINEPTHFTETSSSLLDLFIVNNASDVTLSGVGDPFLGGNIRYHCPVYCILKFPKPKYKTFQRFIWKYNEGDYNLLNNKFANFDWTSVENDDVNIYAEQLTDTILSISKTCIPNKIVTIRSKDTPWFNNNLRKLIRKRKRAHTRAKRTNYPEHWALYRQIRNQTNTCVKESKQNYFDKLAENLQNKYKSKDWWKIAKVFMKGDSSFEIPPILNNGEYHENNLDKANILNKSFSKFSYVDDTNCNLPDYIDETSTDNLISDIQITIEEVDNALKLLDTSKASGPDEINPKILKKCSTELSKPLTRLFNLHYSNMNSHTYGRKLM